jgi:HPt (histidine-containing phosphotransfer) domain-containing protein
MNAAHALKGVAGNLSAGVVAENAREVEVLASNSEWALLDEAISQLKTSSYRLLKLFAEYVED